MCTRVMIKAQLIDLEDGDDFCIKRVDGLTQNCKKIVIMSGVLEYDCIELGEDGEGLELDLDSVSDWGTFYHTETGEHCSLMEVDE